MDHLDLINLRGLMERTTGQPGITVGLLDGPVAINHPDLEGDHIREVPGDMHGACTQAKSAACIHGTFVAGILCAKRSANAPAICPGCTLLVRPIFAEAQLGNLHIPSAAPDQLAAAIIESISAGACVLNLSVALAHSSSSSQRSLEEALNLAARRGVIVIAATGNEGIIGSSAITRHPWVIPVVAYDLRSRLVNQSNLAGSIARRGLGAPGDDVTSLGTTSEPITLGGTSAAVPFVTGAAALLWSEFPAATAAEIKFAITGAQHRRTIVPPLLNAWSAYQFLMTIYGRR